MKRTKLKSYIDIETEVWFQKKTSHRGSSKINGKRIKPGEKFKAKPGDIPEAFKDAFIMIDPSVRQKQSGDDDGFILKPQTEFPKMNPAPKKEEDKAPVVQEKEEDKPPIPQADDESELILQERKTAGWWDIVNVTTGKVLNESALRRDKAEMLLEQLKKD